MSDGSQGIRCTFDPKLAGGECRSKEELFSTSLLLCWDGL